MPVFDIPVLINVTTAQYIHTLNVTGRELPADLSIFCVNNKLSLAKPIVTANNDGVYMSITIAHNNNYSPSGFLVLWTYCTYY